MKLINNDALNYELFKLHIIYVQSVGSLIQIQVRPTKTNLV